MIISNIQNLTNINVRLGDPALCCLWPAALTDVDAGMYG